MRRDLAIVRNVHDLGLDARHLHCFTGEHNSLHWGLDDPAEVEGTDEQKLEAFRRTRTEVATRLRPFVELARKARREPVPAR